MNFKLNILTILFFFTLISYSQQWSGSTNTSQHIERNGDVRIANANLSLFGNQIIGYSTWDSYLNKDNYTIGNFGLTRSKNQINLSGWNGLNLITNRVVRMSILNDGNVGVGTTKPNQKFQVSDGLNMKVSIGALNTAANSYTSKEPVILFNRWSGNTNKFITNGIEILKNNIGTNNYGMAFTRTPLHLENDYSSTNVSMFIENSSGNIGLGTISPSEKLTVKGKVLCEEVKVVLNADAPDFVFETYYNDHSSLNSKYVMPTLEEVEAYTKANNHLPEVPSAKTLKEKGLELKVMSMLLLQKIEELTLYTIEQEKRIKFLEKKINSFKSK